jgi:hypothetical protein
MPTSTIAFSYASAALAFLLFSLPLLTGWRQRPHQRALVAAALLSVLWSALTASAPVLRPAPWLLVGAEWLRNAAWSGVLLSMLGLWKRSARTFQASVAVYGGMLLAIALAPRLPAGLAFHAISIGRLAMAVLGMLLVEQLYRDRSVQVRWAIKFICLGLGAMFAYDFYLYSDTLLLRELDPELWAARGVVNALICRCWRYPCCAARPGRPSWRYRAASPSIPRPCSARRSICWP